MLVYVAYPMSPVEPQWVAPLAAALHEKHRVHLYRPWIPLNEQLQNPDLRDDLLRPPRPSFIDHHKALKLPDILFGDLNDPEVQAFLLQADGADPLIKSADKDLYCLMRSDMMLVDLSTPSFGDQGVDLLFGHLSGMPVVGLTDRFQNAPSLVSRLDCLIAPTSVGQIVRAIELFGGKAKGPSSSEKHEPPSDEPSPEPLPPTEPEITKDFADGVLRVAGSPVTKAEDDNGGHLDDQVS